MLMKIKNNRYKQTFWLPNHRLGYDQLFDSTVSRRFPFEAGIMPALNFNCLIIRCLRVYCLLFSCFCFFHLLVCVKWHTPPLVRSRAEFECKKEFIQPFTCKKGIELKCNFWATLCVEKSEAFEHSRGFSLLMVLLMVLVGMNLWKRHHNIALW